ncbi:MAG: hypothetical protein SGJ18_01230 [Pseudomonadota bacterium]|nr:hypothetical protein [Pseudomonadota bacterium]
MGLSEKFHNRIQRYIKILQKYADRIWYPPLIGMLAALDNFVIIIPNDGILISSSMLTPRRWFSLALSVAIGSTVGASILASFVETQGFEWILEMYPGINETKSWIWTADFFEKYGMLLVFIVAITPVMQQPSIIVASLAETPLFLLAAIVFSGRFIKFLLMAYVGSHAPRFLNKMWGLKGELNDVGINRDTL